MQTEEARGSGQWHHAGRRLGSGGSRTDDDEEASSEGSDPRRFDSQASAPATLTYDDVKRPFLELVKAKGNAAGRAVLTHFGFKASLTEATPELYADIIAHIAGVAK